jgi:hypothetical protein
MAVTDLKKGLPASASGDEYAKEISTLLGTFQYGEA